MPAKTSRAAAIFFILSSLAVLAFAEYDRRTGTAPKNQLTVVAGRATEVSVTESRVRYGGRVYTVHFSCGGITTEYKSSRPEYQRLLAAIQSNQLLTLAVFTKGGTILQQNGKMPIYAAYIGSQPILTYEETAAHNSLVDNAVFLTGGIMLCIAIWRFSKTSPGGNRQSPAGYRGNFVGPRVR